MMNDGADDGHHDYDHNDVDEVAEDDDDDDDDDDDHAKYYSENWGAKTGTLAPRKT